jgi:transcription elongation factor Elf1
MSQLNNNVNNNNNVQGTGNKVAEELRQMKIERQQLDKRDKMIRFRCDHKDSHGRPAVQPGKEDGTLVCRICGTVINARVQTTVEVDRKLREVLNIIETIKIASNSELTPSLAKIEEGVDSLLALYEKVILKQGNANKNKGNNNNNNQRRAAYGSSKL